MNNTEKFLGGRGDLTIASFIKPLHNLFCKCPRERYSIKVFFIQLYPKTQTFGITFDAECDCDSVNSFNFKSFGLVSLQTFFNDLKISVYESL